MASQIIPGASGAMAIEGSDTFADPQDATELGSSRPNKIDLWGKALSQIQQSQDKKSAEMDIQKQMQESIAGKEAKTESDGWIITIGQKEYHVREYVEKTTVILEKFAGTVSKFMGAVDVAVSFDPAHAALPWAAVRLVLTAVIAAHEFKGRVAVGLAKVAVLVSQCHIYQRFYMTSDTSTDLDRSEVDSLEDAIITVYTQSLLFLAFAHKKSKMRALKASWKLSDLEGYFEKLKDASDDLVQAADNCQKLLEKRTGVKVREVVELLKDFGATIYEQRELIIDIGQRALLSELKCADGANYNSAEDQAEPRCHEKTRIELLKAGNAGTGKSTISRTVAEMFDAKSKLGASFFFKRGRGDRASGSRFFTTISSQLCHNRPRFAQSVAKAISEDRNIVTANYTDQLEKLILEPTKALVRDPNNCTSILIVVDALDECEEDTHVQIMIQSLGQIKKLKECGVDLRLFITSRPEVHIRRGFQEILDCQKEVVLHNISGDVIQQDIIIYLKDELAQIRKRHNKIISQFGQPIEEDWPGDERIKSLAKMATPLFIFAATVCRLLDCDNPREEIDRIVSQGQKPHDQTLDGAYEAAPGRILKGKENSSGESKIVGNFGVVVGSIVLLEEPLSVPALAQLLGTSPETVLNMVTSVSSVLNVPRDGKTPVKTFHLSFREFLINKQRNKSPKLQIDEDKTHRDLADKCLQLLLKSGILKNDICKLGTLDTKNQDVTQNTIDDKLPPQVQYACRYWVHHTKKGNVKLHNKHPAYEFLKKHFLHWLEVLSLIGRLSETIGLIRELLALVDLNGGEKVSEFLHDANRFLLHSFTAINQTPLQLYASALLFAPTNSIVRKFFEDDISWVIHKPTVEKDWSPCLQTIDRQSWGGSVSVSGNGKLIVLGSYDGGVKVWDASTGVLQKTLESEGVVASVAFFFGSELIAARSRDGTIKIWNTETGRLQRTLQGNSDNKFSVSRAFSLASSNSGLIASVSYNGIFEIWDAPTGALRKSIMEGL
uniref:NACHT domain-containing protein n=1 Tax=Bionectria ochroleuca TaxID=29856 RepID=A0A8H7N7D5_BIOOC